MLILNRRVGESIIIGDREIEIIVMSATKGRVTLGIDADEAIPVFRDELLAKPAKETDYVY